VLNFKADGNRLILKKRTVEFDYPIDDAQKFKKYIIVLLEPSQLFIDRKMFNELYAVSKDGEIVWQMEDMRNKIGKAKPTVLVGFDFEDGLLQVADYYSRTFILDPDTGKIVKVEPSTRF